MANMTKLALEAALKKVVSVKHPEMYDFNRKALEMGRTFE